jgi:hypothetical protein
VIAWSRLHQRRRGEDGAALPIALGVLIICAVVTAIIVQYTGAGTAASVQLAKERNNIYAADGAIDTAIEWVQSDSLFQRASVDGSDANCALQNGNGNTFYTASDINGATVNVTCVSTPGPAGAGAQTMAPGFSILTLAPFQGLAPTSGCNNTRDELGLVQVQSDKLLQVHGNVYINSDADSDIWSGGCPQTSTAKHIQVLGGEVLQRESEHDVDNYPLLHNHVLDHDAQGNLTNNNVGLPDPLSAADAAKLQDPGLGPNASQWAPNINAGNIPAPAAVPACPALNAHGFRVVPFSPGTYSDAAAMSALMSGGCTNAVFWFRPGNYYFNFTNAGSHEWTIDDTSTRVIGGQPTGVTTNGQQFPGTWKPTATSNVSVFTNPNNALNIDTATTNATFTSGSAALTTTTFVPPAGQGLIPADATINSVVLHVRHQESSATLLNTPTVTVTPGGGAACTGLAALTRSTTFVDDQITLFPTPSCLNLPSKINSGLTVRYSVSHCSGTGGGCSATSATDRLDGISVDVTYSTGSRPAWDGNDPDGVDASTPAVPGGCRHELDPGWTDGVQFVFGGDSHVNLKSGKLELCNQQSTTHQEIVLYGLRGATPPPPQSATLTATAAAGANWTNPGNGTTIDNSTATTAFSGTTSASRSLTLSGFGPTPNIDPASTNFGVTMRVAHSETSTSRINSRQVAIKDATGATTYCTVTVNSSSSLTTQTMTVPAGCLTIARLTAGIQATYTVGYQCSSSCSSTATAALDGIDFTATWTPPAVSGGGLAAGSGCVTQVPYYNPPGASPGPDHAPGYNGACALVKVARDGTDGGHFPRIVAFWGTVYAPSAALDLPVDVLTVPVFNRGVVARMMMLGYNIATDAPAPISTDVLIAALQNRRTVLTATVGSSRVVADVEYCDHDYTPCNGTPNGVKIHTWRVTR